jgi:hypothetical protein
LLGGEKYGAKVGDALSESIFDLNSKLSSTLALNFSSL